jgi:hypothetical protein
MKKWLSILKTVGPTIVSLTVPGGVLLAPIIVTAIAEAEKQHTTGAEKKAKALALIHAGVSGVNAASQGKVTIDPETAVSAAGHAIDTVVQTVNIIEHATPDTDPVE